MKEIRLKGKRIDLYIPTMKDVDGIVKHANDPKIAQWLDNLPHPYKRKDGEFFVKKIVRKGVEAKTDYPFVIYEKEHGEIIGGIGIHHVNNKHKHAEIGYWIGRKFWRQGYGTEAVNLLLRFAFRRLKMNKVYARAFGPNKASQALLKKAGFKPEGLFRKHSFKHGKFHDEPRFGLLREEYDKQN
ncbi:GNAT family N-acetyltransferase [Candidatus Woesearchaeota archaeon]|nr:GNAT family N-acetyltransferase [Candidatus Woesearchaeota archaeon]